MRGGNLIQKGWYTWSVQYFMGEMKRAFAVRRSVTLAECIHPIHTIKGEVLQGSLDAVDVVRRLLLNTIHHLEAVLY